MGEERRPVKRRPKAAALECARRNAASIVRAVSPNDLKTLLGFGLGRSAHAQEVQDAHPPSRLGFAVARPPGLNPTH